MVGVNVPIPVPLAYYTFGGWKRSGFGDLNQHGPDSIRFYTKTKTVTSRWPSGIKDGAEFSIPTMCRRPPPWQLQSSPGRCRCRPRRTRR
jgi:malonate-semialdehyde dehydrogenase (acetylating)/methylmalonate-semialdehyde dehydrogenase